MTLLSRARISQSQAIQARHALAPAWRRAATQLVFVLGAALFADVALATQISAQSGAVTIARGSSAKSAAREAKRAERAAAREAKRKERAARTNHSDDSSLAKAKSGKKSSGSSVDLGDNDPLDGL